MGMSRTFKTVNYEQALDLTVRLGDCLPPDHLARFVVDSVAQLYEEVVALGYPGSLRTVDRIVRQFRPQKTQAVSRQTITQRNVLSTRSAALMMVRPAQH